MENAKQASCLFLRPIPAHCFSGGGGVGSDVLVNPTKVLPGTTPSKYPCGGFIQLCPPGTTPQSPGGTTPETTQPPGGTIGTTDNVADGSVPAGPDGNCPGGLVKTSVGVPKGAEGNARLGHSKQTQVHVQGEHRLQYRNWWRHTYGRRDKDTNNINNTNNANNIHFTGNNVVNKIVFEGREPIGSSSSSSFSSSSSSSAVPASGTLVTKPFEEFNNPANAAAGLVITDSTMTKNQPTAESSSSSSGGQLDITGSIQNIRPASAATGITSDPTTTTGAAATTSSNINDIINTASMTVVEATFFDKANNIV